MKIYRKRIHQWSERHGDFRTVWFYTKKVMLESLANYREMELADLPQNVRDQFTELTETNSVVQDCDTNEILKVY